MRMLPLDRAKRVESGQHIPSIGCPRRRHQAPYAWEYLVQPRLHVLLRWRPWSKGRGAFPWQCPNVIGLIIITSWCWSCLLRKHAWSRSIDKRTPSERFLLDTPILRPKCFLHRTPNDHGKGGGGLHVCPFNLPFKDYSHPAPHFWQNPTSNVWDFQLELEGKCPESIRAWLADTNDHMVWSMEWISCYHRIWLNITVLNFFSNWSCT